MTDEEFEKSFDGTICRLMINCPLVFNMLVGMEKIEDPHIETMGVSVRNGAVSLRYNRSFVEPLDERERNFCLMHEMMHVMLHHCTHRRSENKAYAYIDNVAMDLAINCMIPNDQFTNMPVFKESKFGKRAGDPAGLLPSQFDFPEKLSYEQYKDLLIRKYDLNDPSQVSFMGDDSGGSSGNGTGDGSGNGNSSGSGENGDDIDENCALGQITKGRISADHGEEYDEDPVLDDIIADMIEEATRNNTWGNIGYDAIEIVKAAQARTLNWGNLLRLYAGDFISPDKTPTRRRWNKHYGKPFLGTVTKFTEPVAVYVDTSGSVDIDSLSRFVSEIERIAYYTGVYLWSFDTTVKEPDSKVVFTRGAIGEIKFIGRGGTDFEDCFNHARKYGYSQLVIMTDGFACDVDPKSADGMDVVWVITKNGNPIGKPGRVVEMT
ncbi:MAG: VWA-like domain-containing protein [Fibrobacter sp.]|nr:VWA-like domain-containing protein [Fibrobacter sp.]